MPEQTAPAPTYYVLGNSSDAGVAWVRINGDTTKSYNVIDPINQASTINIIGNESSTLYVVGTAIPNWDQFQKLILGSVGLTVIYDNAT